MTGNNPTSLVIIHRFFWPQNLPYANMLKHIAQRAKDDGFKVEILSTHSDIAEREIRSSWAAASGIKTQSVNVSSGRQSSALMKLISSIYFTIWTFFKLVQLKPNLVLVATTPPVIMAAVVRLASRIRGFQYIYHCQDIHPEAMALNENISTGFLYKLLSLIDKKNISCAKRVITLSTDMRDTLAKRGCDTKHIRVVNNFVYEAPPPPSHANVVKKQVASFIFSGTLGLFQNLDLLMGAILLFKGREDVIFNFMGDGCRRRELEHIAKLNGLKNVNFLGQRSVREAMQGMQEADFGFVSIAPRITEVAYPSKTMMYLSNGLPIFAIVDEDSEIFEFINNNQIGVAVSPSSIENIYRAIERAILAMKAGTFSRTHISEIADQYFSKEVILNKFSGVLTECKA